jgi:hypothetical protein
MALDRTWYNSLVDDDGSGMTGSVWDKADVDALMDAIDAEIARLDGAVGTRVNWTPTVTDASGSPLAVSTNTCKYAIIGDQLFWSVSLIGITVLSSTGHLRVTTPAGVAPLTGTGDTAFARLTNGTTGVYDPGFLQASTAWLEAYRTPAGSTVQNFTAGPWHLLGTGFYFIR